MCKTIGPDLGPQYWENSNVEKQRMLWMNQRKRKEDWYLQQLRPGKLQICLQTGNCADYCTLLCLIIPEGSNGARQNNRANALFTCSVCLSLQGICWTFNTTSYVDQLPCSICEIDTSVLCITSNIMFLSINEEKKMFQSNGYSLQYKRKRNKTDGQNNFELVCVQGIKLSLK